MISEKFLLFQILKNYSLLAKLIQGRFFQPENEYQGLYLKRIKPFLLDFFNYTHYLVWDYADNQI